MARFIKNNLANFLVIFIISVSVFAGIFYYLSVNTKGAESQEIKILPTDYSGTWQNSGAALVQDIDPEAGFEEFNKENSAFLFEIYRVQEPTQTPTESDIQADPPSDQSESIETDSSQSEGLGEQFEDLGGEVASPSEEPVFDEEIPSPSEPFLEEPVEEIPASPSAQVPYVLGILLDLIASPSEELIASESEELIDEEPIVNEKSIEELATESEETIVEEPIDEIATESEDVILEVEPPITEEPPTRETISGFIEKTLEFSDFSVPEDFAGQDIEIKNVQLRLSLAGKGEVGEKLIIDYYYQDFWQNLAELDLENEISNATNDGYWLYALPIFENWEDLENLRIRFTFSSKFQILDSRFPEVYLDAIWLEVEYEGKHETDTELKHETDTKLTSEDVEVKLISKRKNFKLDDEPEFKFKYRRKKNILETLTVGIIDLFRDEYKDINIKATVSGLDINPNIRYQGEGEFFVDLSNFEKPRQFRPGTYVLKIEIEDGGQIFVQNQDFVWGVLAINTNKSIYLPNEQAYLQMAVLRDDGHTICDARLELRIWNLESGIDATLSTEDGTIKYSGKCGPDNVVDMPDYFAYYQVGEVGTYQMKLTNLDNKYEITDSFEVRDSVPFEIERIGPTRIYPPAIYNVKLIIKANQDFQGEIKEYIPESFEIKPDNLKIENCEIENSLKIENCKLKIISWQVDWKAGETHELEYQFDAPDISPYLYLLGPLRLVDTRLDQAIFEEIRQWQIASDATQSATGSAATNTSWANGWTAGDLNTDDSSETTFDTDTSDDVGTVYAFNFDQIGDSDTINGILVEIDAWEESALCNSIISVRLSYDGGSGWAPETKSTPELILSENRESLGGLSDDWGYGSWTKSALDNLVVEVTATNVKDKKDVYVDYIQVTVDYSAPQQAPVFDSGYEPWESPASTDTTPTDMDADVTFKATATDANEDGWYLAVCKGEGITAGAGGIAPTCTGGAWVVSTSSSASGAEITETYTITSGETLESYAWYAYACDDNSDSACTAAYSNSGRTGTGGTPFSVNHRPTFTAVSDEAGNPGATDVTITATTYNDTDTGGAQDTVSMYVCTTAAFTGGASPACTVDEWCNVTGVTPTATLACDLTVPDPQAHGEVNYYPYVVDIHGFAATGGKQGSTEAFTVNDVAPTVSGTPTLNNAAAIDLTAEKSTTDIAIKGIVTDDNSCQDIVAANVTVDVWQTLLATRTGCDTAGEADSNKCYPDVTCAYDSVTEECTGTTDKTGGYKCTVSFQYYANPTDANTPWSTDSWTATLIPGDGQGENTAGEANTAAVEMNSFLAMDLTTDYDSIAYGEVNPNTYTDPLNAETRVEATGNCGLKTNLSGTTMTGDGDPIPIDNQRYASASSAPAWSTGTALSGTPTEFELGVCKSGYTGTPEYGKLWWGIEIDQGQASGEYSGTNTIEAIKDGWSNPNDWCEAP